MKQEIKTRQCPGCKVVLPYQEGLDHLLTVGFGRYGVSSPECLALFNQVFIREYECGRPQHGRIDAYGVQHPPHADVQKSLGINERLIAASKQSVAIHLIALYLMIEKKMPLDQVAGVMDHILKSGAKLENEELIPPASLGTMTVADAAQAETCQEHVRLIKEWERSVWQAWKSYHHKVQEWVEKYGK